jgi:hypothetical protein
MTARWARRRALGLLCSAWLAASAWGGPVGAGAAADEVGRESATRHASEAGLLRLEGALRAKLAGAAGSGDEWWGEALVAPDSAYLLWSPRPAKSESNAIYRVAIDIRTRWYYVVKADGAGAGGASYFGPLDEANQGEFVDVVRAAPPAPVAAQAAPAAEKRKAAGSSSSPRATKVSQASLKAKAGTRRDKAVSENKAERERKAAPGQQALEAPTPRPTKAVDTVDRSTVLAKATDKRKRREAAASEKPASKTR